MISIKTAIILVVIFCIGITYANWYFMPDEHWLRLWLGFWQAYLCGRIVNWFVMEE